MKPHIVIALGLIATAAQAATVQVTVLSRDGLPLPDAVVLIEPADAPKVAPPAPVQARIDQHKMQFLPMVSVVPVGSTVRFTNLDRWEHHVRALPAGLGALSAAGTAGTGHETRLAGQVEGQAPAFSDITFHQAGALRLGCHLHGSMRGFIFVSDSPHVAKTDANGEVTLQNVPEGAARVRVWHGEQLVDLPPLDTRIGSVNALRFPTSVQPRRRR